MPIPTPRHGDRLPLVTTPSPCRVRIGLPCLGVGIGMGYVPVAVAEPGTPIEVDVRGKLRRAEVRSKPLYAKDAD